MYEKYHEPLLPRSQFLLRLLRHGGIALAVLLGSLLVGVLAYHIIEGMSWIDSLLNASMILGGMGPVNELHTTAGKVFASFYALYSGVVFLVIAALLSAPLFHRFLHHFHIEEEGDNSGG